MYRPCIYQRDYNKSDGELSFVHRKLTVFLILLQNPSFRFFDLSSCGPHITRLDYVTIKVWARSSSSEEFHLLIELQLSLQSLQFIGKAVRILISLLG